MASCLRARQPPSQAACRCRSALPYLLSEPGPKLGPEPLDEIAPLGSRLSVVLATSAALCRSTASGRYFRRSGTNIAGVGRNAP